MPTTSNTTNGDASGLRVLVVDDSKPAADMLAMILESFGNELRTAYDGHEATRLAESFRPDVILLDIGMPGMDGYEAARRIRAQPGGSEAVLIALSGFAPNGDADHAGAKAFDHRVVKPAKAADLLALLSRVKAARS